VTAWSWCGKSLFGAGDERKGAKRVKNSEAKREWEYWAVPA
jgi:hypothetical protein